MQRRLASLIAVIGLGLPVLSTLQTRRRSPVKATARVPRHVWPAMVTMVVARRQQDIRD